MWGNYITRVVEEYHRQRNSNTLRLQLKRPTTAKLREACEQLCDGTMNRKDEKVLNDFFAFSGDRSTYVQTIRRFDIDKFRPLLNFINGRTNKTDDKNIELLALLIDFKERPFELGKKYLPEDGNNEVSNEIEAVNHTEKKPQELKEEGEIYNDPTPTQPEKAASSESGKKKLIVAVLGIIILGIIFFVLINNKKSKFGSVEQESCMYWAGDHYERTACTTKINNVIIVALDTNRLHNFKKITKTDTITQNAVGYVWYYKKDGEFEYYSSGGRHPIYMNDDLRPITRYIIAGHLQNNSAIPGR